MDAHNGNRFGMHKLLRRADKTSVTTSTTVTTTKGSTTTTKAATSTAVTKAPAVSTSVPTTPPTATKATSSVALSSYAASFATVKSNYSPTVASQASASAASERASAQPVLSEAALIGIIAGAGALGFILVAMFSWWCWKSRKAKREEAKWWKLDAVGKHAPGKQDGGDGSGRQVPFAPVGAIRRPGNDDTWGTKPGAGGRGGEKEKEWGFPDGSTTPGAGGAPFGHYTTQTMAPPASAPAPTARELLLGIGAGAPAARAGKTGRDPRESPQDASVQPETASLLPPSSGNNLSPLGSSNDPAQRPVQPSVGNDTKDDAAAVRSQKARNRQSGMMRSNKKDTVMNFADAYGGATYAGWEPVPPSPTTPIPSSIIPPKRGASVGAIGTRAVPPPDVPRSPLPASSPSSPNSFPPQPRERAQNPSQTQYGRVDSKPLRELEDILDSFGHNSVGVLPPVPEADTLRGSMASSTATPPPSGPAPVTPLNLSRSAWAGPLNLPSSNSTSSLSPTSALFPPRGPHPYALNHHPISIYSTQGDVGELPSSQPSSPNKAAFADPSPAGSWSSPDRPHPPTTGSGHAHHFMGPQADEFNSQSSSVFSSTQLDFPLPSPVSTQFVRKISLKKTDAPMRMTREESIRRRREDSGSPSSMTGPTKAERDIVAQMGLDSGYGGSPSTSSRSSSPPHTPRDFDFGPLASSAKLQPHDALAGTGFVPLSAMTLDVGANNYRSATESIYGMYDDLPPDLLCLPRDDPKVSRHISSYGLANR